MAYDENVSVMNYPKPRPSEVLHKRPEQPMFRMKCPAIVLDMGEASREEGFRLNGCR